MFFVRVCLSLSVVSEDLSVSLLFVGTCLCLSVAVVDRLSVSLFCVRVCLSLSVVVEGLSLSFCC